MRTLTILALLALGACATPKVWRHTSKGQQDFYRDNSQCMAMAGSGHAPSMVPGAGGMMQGYNQGAAMQALANQRAIHQQCMLGNGWVLE